MHFYPKCHIQLPSENLDQNRDIPSEISNHKCIFHQKLGFSIITSWTTTFYTAASWERVHGARTVHTAWGNYTAFSPQLDPHRKVLDSNICTQKTANNWVSHEFLAVRIESGLYTTELLMYNI